MNATENTRRDAAAQPTAQVASAGSSWDRLSSTLLPRLAAISPAPLSRTVIARAVPLAIAIVVVGAVQAPLAHLGATLAPLLYVGLLLAGLIFVLRRWSAPKAAAGPDAASDENAERILDWLQRRIGGEIRDAVERALPHVMARVRQQAPPPAVISVVAGKATEAGAGAHDSKAVSVVVLPPAGTDAPVVTRSSDAAPTSSSGRPAETPQPRHDDGKPGSAARSQTAPETLDLTRYRLEPYVQPFYDHTGALMGVDTLLRWRHPVLGIVGPETLLPAFVAQGKLQSLLSSQMVKTAKFWKRIEATRPGLSLAIRVDLSARADEDRLRFLGLMLKSGGIDPARLLWDVSARQALANPAEFDDWCRLCRRHGFKVTVSGWPASAPLRRALSMSVDVIQLDVRNGGAARFDHEGIAEARAAGLVVVAAGLDDLDSARLAVKAGVDGLLGFGLAEPLNVDDFLGGSLTEQIGLGSIDLTDVASR